MDPTFTVTPDRTAVEIADPIENARFELHTPEPVELADVPADEFYFPVDAAVAVETTAIGVPKLANVLVRTQDGELVADNADHVDRSLDWDAYTVELSTAPMKLYLSVESSIDVRHDDRAVTVAFDGPTEVRIGARSFHDQPANTITTTADPEGAMRALSLLGSALKTTSPERSFPTLRGHPPLVEVGDEFHAPEGIETPDTGVRIELPADYEYVYPAASLAYYLGAEVVPAEYPKLITDEGFEYDLAGPLGYEETVGRVLRQTFLLDCVTRTEGYYQVDLHEREAVEPHVDMDFAALYDQSLAERLETYLSVPFETVEEFVPNWNLTTDVMATPTNVEVLPFVANDLALVRCPGAPSAASVTPTTDSIDEFFRSGPEAGRAATNGDDFTRSASDTATRSMADTATQSASDTATQSMADTATRSATDTSAQSTADIFTRSMADIFTRSTADTFTRSTTDSPSASPVQDEIFNPEPADTVEHAWVGEGFPVGANKATVEAYRRRVERSAPEKTSIDIHVVCNDERMKDEGVVEEFYGLRDLLQFDVSVHYELTTDELREVLAESADFLHYVGHVDDRGMRCPDGHLDARTVEEVNVKAFVLNACRSYAQGEALVASGSYGGVVTLSEVANSVATPIGQTLARLLNCGFSLRVALSIVKDTIAPAYQYSTIGDGGLTLCQSESGTPLHLEVESLESGKYEVQFKTYPSPSHGLGSMQKPNIGDVNTRYIAAGVVDTYELTGDELDAFFDLEVLPIELDGELRWSDEVALTER